MKCFFIQTVKGYKRKMLTLSEALEELQKARQKDPTARLMQ